MSGGNTTSIPGVPELCTTPVADLEAYDTLPSPIRKVLQEAVLNVAAVEVVRGIERGVPEGAIIRAIENFKPPM